MNHELGEIKACYGVWFRRKSQHSPSRVWRAITDSAEVSRWMSYPARIDVRPGGAYHIDFSRTGEGSLDGVISHVEPGRRLLYVWGTSTVEWVLEEDGNGTSFLFAHHGQYPRPIPDEEGLAAGWHAWLEDLERFLDTGSPSPEPEGASRWRALGKLYRPRLEAVLSLDVPANSQ